MQILKKKTDYYLWRNIHLTKSRIIIFVTLFVMALILFIMNHFFYASFGLITIPIAYVLGIYTYQRYLLWRSGTVGEDIVTRELKKLNDSYYLINNIVVPPNRGDTDHIVLGPNGIFVIESKNYGGEIKCIGDSWSRYKIGRKGKPYELWIGSPSNQVKRNAKVLKDFILGHKDKIFRENKHIWVHGIVVFTNKNANLHIEKPTIDILRIEELCDFIKQQNSEFQLSDDEVKNIGNVLLECNHATKEGG